MTEPDKGLRALLEELWKEVEEYKGLPLTQELKENLPSKVMEILTPVSPGTVEAVHSPLEGDPLRIEITIGFSIECLPRLLGL